MLDLLLLEPRREPKRLGRFHRGAHKVEGFVIGKDDPVVEGAPVLIDRFVWD
jgi:hypothetical protein